MEEVLEEFYRCGLCEDTITFPKKLKCQHVFCHTCLVVYITTYFGKASFPCPVCEYKHSPVEQEVVISQNSLLIPEEDALLRDVSRFFKDGKEPKSIHQINRINRVPCIFHNGKPSDFLCTDCNMLACERCKREIHARCDLQYIHRSIRLNAFTQTRTVSAELTNCLSETETVNKNLDSKLRNIFPDTAEQEDGIRSYYSDLTEKVVKYLKEQEEKVIKKARELKERERAHLDRDALISTKMISSVKIRKQLADALKELYTTNAPETLVISNHLRKDFVVFNAMLSELQSDVDTRYNVRFLINTEVEDILTEADIVKIEVIDCCHEEASAVTFQEETEVDQQELNEQVPAEDDGIAPPPYISVARNSFIQRPRPPASVPSLPADNDTRASRRPAQHPDNLHPLSLSPFLNHGAQSPCCSPRPQLQPSAPPMYRDGSAQQISFAEARSDALPRRATVAQSVTKTIPSDVTNVAFRYKTKISTKTTGDLHNPSLVGVATLGEYFIIADQKNTVLCVSGMIA